MMAGREDECIGWDPFAAPPPATEQAGRGDGPPYSASTVRSSILEIAVLVKGLPVLER